MLYTRRRFSLPASSANGEMCKTKGHSAPDGNGRCLCCGEKTAEVLHPSAADTVATLARLRGRADGETI